jgi:hypothetical protein
LQGGPDALPVGQASGRNAGEHREQDGDCEARHDRFYDRTICAARLHLVATVELDIEGSP